ncbi:hypothetical protein FA13DRAFT_1637034, partial [Coprinellus micaceus]
MAQLLWYFVLLTSKLAFPALHLAAAADNSTSRLAISATTCLAVESSPAFNTQYRSTIKIVWSCLAIIFASTWVCVHPNVAGYKTTKCQRLWKHLKIFALAIFSPELLAMFAFLQWRGLFYLNGPQEAAWTLTHAHFVQMGGIVFKAQGGQAGFKNPKVWDDEEIKSFFALRVPEEAISRSTRISVLAKMLVVMQVLWFVIQTVARAVEGLPITHLEVACLAFISFNIGMYICWWDKPLDV